MSLESMPTVGGPDVLPNPIPEADPEPPKPDPTRSRHQFRPYRNPHPHFSDSGQTFLGAGFCFCNRPSQKQWRQSGRPSCPVTRFLGSPN